ncbi:MAG: sensor histidine kinase [Pirellulales bacterium]
MKQKLSVAEVAPGRLYVALLAIVFLSEFCVMLILPQLPIHSMPSWFVGVIDATMLTALMVPLFGWLIVRPLRQVVRVRSQLLQQFLALQEEERKRIARDLHDEIGQSFTAVLMGLRTLDVAAPRESLKRRLNELAAMVTQTLDEVRRLARGLHPAVLDHLGLVRAIEQYADEFQGVHGVAVDLSVAGADAEQRVSPAVQTTVYRIVQECLTNTARHAEASRAWITLKMEPHRLAVQFSDDGKGFSKREVDPAATSGLLGMAERAALCGGELHIDTRPGDGVRIELQVPLA